MAGWHTPTEPLEGSWTVATRYGEVAVTLHSPPTGLSGSGSPSSAGGAATRPAGDEVPVVVLLHGNPGDSRDFDELVDRLRGRHVVAAVDWPGYGKSTVHEPAALSAERLVEVAETVLEVLLRRGATSFALVGNSVGGFVAVRLAARRPDIVTRLVLVNSAGFTRLNAVTRLFCRKVMGRPAVAAHLAGPLVRVLLGRLRTPTIAATNRRARELRHNPDQLLSYSSLWRSFADPRFDVTAEASDLRMPVLLIWGRRDPLLPYVLDGRRARRALRRATCVTLDAGHESFSEVPDLFWRYVEPFLEASRVV